MRDKKRLPAESRPLLMRKRRVLEILPSEPSSWECGSLFDDSRASSITPFSDTQFSNSTPPVYGNVVLEKKDIGVDDAEKVCFGTIKDVLIQLKWFSKSAISNSIEPGLNHGSHNGNPLRVFRLTFQPEQYCLVQTVPGGENVGVLENRAVKHLTSLALHPLYPITFEAVIEESIWNDKFTTAMNGGGRGAQCISVEIDAFGERHMGDEVGRALGGVGFFLQRPSRLFFLPMRIHNVCSCLILTIRLSWTGSCHYFLTWRKVQSVRVDSTTRMIQARWLMDRSLTLKRCWKEFVG